jgi:hypothetical protein
VREYVRLVKRRWAETGVGAQAEAFRRGIDDFFPARSLAGFSAAEMAAMLLPRPLPFTEENVRRCFRPQASHDAWAVDALVAELLQATRGQRRQILAFATNVPVLHAGLVRAPMEVKAESNKHCLVRARNCGNIVFVSDVFRGAAGCAATRLALHEALLWAMRTDDGTQEEWKEWKDPAA